MTIKYNQSTVSDLPVKVCYNFSHFFRVPGPWAEAGASGVSLPGNIDKQREIAEDCRPTCSTGSRESVEHEPFLWSDEMLRPCRDRYATI